LAYDTWYNTKIIEKRITAISPYEAFALPRTSTFVGGNESLSPFVLEHS